MKATKTADRVVVSAVKKVDRQLADLNVSTEERRALQRPYVQLIGFDFYMLFTRLLDRYGEWKGGDLLKQLNGNNTEETKRAREAFSEAFNEWRKRALGNNVYERRDVYKFDEEITRAAPDDWLNERERKAAAVLRAQMVRMFADCETKGGYTTEAAQFYDRYQDLGGYDRKIEELFGVNPSATK